MLYGIVTESNCTFLIKVLVICRIITSYTGDILLLLQFRCVLPLPGGR